jgi:pyruvate/2-oxoglutarate dehydrogenase complex dihydrolipoamide acyltransferase (E2) component
MSTKINLPKSGMGIDEGTIVRWLKSVGERVEKDEVLVEVETAKAIQEVLAPAGGVLTRVLVQVGETTAVNSTLGLID